MCIYTFIYLYMHIQDLRGRPAEEGAEVPPDEAPAAITMILLLLSLLISNHSNID